MSASQERGLDRWNSPLPEAQASLAPRNTILIRGAYVMTMDPESGDLPVGDILVHNGEIIAVGENLRSLWEFKNYISAGAVSYPEPDVTNCGGVTAFMKIARLAEAFNLPVTSHGAHDITVRWR